MGSHLDWFEAHLELLGACDGRDDNILQACESIYCLLQVGEIDEGIAQGADAGREDCNIRQVVSMGHEDGLERARSHVRRNVTTPDASAGILQQIRAWWGWCTWGQVVLGMRMRVRREFFLGRLQQPAASISTLSRKDTTQYLGAASL